MPTINEERQRIADFKAAKYITGALRDISAIELKSYREKFEKNNALNNELQALYRLISHIAEREGKTVKLASKERLNIAYTTNRHFYGSLNRDVMKKFTATTASNDRCLIIGDTGKELWREEAKKRKEVRYLSFADDMPSEAEAKAFFQQIEPYGPVYIYYPGFVSVFKQDVQILDITFREKAAAKEDDGPETPQYILEPEIIEMFAFFETQVRYVLFEQMLLETQLSRVAARLMKMDFADENATKLINHERRELRRARAAFSSIRMLETFTGFIQWHKNHQPIGK